MSQIITLDDLTTYSTGTTIDPGLGQQVVDAVNAYIETYTGRCFGETKQAVERYDYQRVVWLNSMDMQSITSVTLGYPGQTQTTIDPQNYYMVKSGRLVFPGLYTPGYAAPQDFAEITYTYGLIEAPDDLRLAALGIAQGFYNASQNGQQDVSEVQVGSYRVQYASHLRGSENGSKHGANDNNWAVVDSYKRKNI